MIPSLHRLRARIVLLASVVVAGALLLGAWTTVNIVRSRATQLIDEDVGRRFDDIRGRIDAGRLEPTIETFGDSQDVVVQVVVDRRVVAATANVASLGPFPDDGCPDDRGTIQIDSVDDSPFRFIMSCFRVDRIDYVVRVAINRDDLDETTRSLVVGLAVALPGVLAVLVIALWWLAGRLLRRVDAATSREQRFVADAAHELRSPLARMITALEVDGAAAAPVALRDARHLAKLTDDLLALSRLDAGPSRRDELVDLDDVVLRAVGVCRAHLGSPVTIDCSEVSAAQVRGDATLLEHLTANLLDNAVRHAVERITVSLRTDGDDVRLRVSDDGPGVADDLAPSIFERFVRGDAPRTPGSGSTGLGLAIVHSIAQRHDGTVRLLPSGTGASFEVILAAVTGSGSANSSNTEVGGV